MTDRDKYTPGGRRPSIPSMSYQPPRRGRPPVGLRQRRNPFLSRLSLSPTSRGQMEIMGLAIVVILITLGVLFALTTLQQDEGGGEQAFEQKGIAGGFLNSFLGTTTPCERLTIQDLVRDCAQRGGFVCPAEHDPFRGAPGHVARELDSCAYVNQTAAYLFNQTLDIRKVKYLLSAKGPNMERIGIGSPCRGEQVLASQPIPTRVGTVTIELRVCG